MEANVYNVIWADDEIDAYTANEAKMTIMRKANIRLLATAHTSNELRDKLNLYESAVDAVITDGNFDRTKIVDVNKSTSGLNDVLNFIEVFNSKRIIPFYLYTGKSQFLLDRFPDGELDYFMNLDRYFEKAEFSEMLDRIKSDVEHINSLQFRIRNKYVREFEAAKLIEDAERNLEKGLLYQYNEDWKDVQDYFTPARKIFERIVDKLKEQKKLPPISKLNTMGKLLVNGKYEDDECSYELRQEVMPAPLAHSLQFFLDITQDGSHDNGDLKLGVDSYIRKSHNTNLFNSILFITMDLLLWHMDYSKDNNAEEIWSGGPKFEYTGKACLSPDGRYWYTGEYELMKDKDLTDGVSIGVKWGLDNTKPKTGIKKFVPRKGYVIIKD